MAQILIWGNGRMFMLYVEIPELLVWGEDDDYNFGHEGICGTGRTFTVPVGSQKW